jgi:tetratricopeptide (TPR) repeat protein
MSKNQQDMFENPVARARELKARRRYDEAQKVLEAALSRNPEDLRAKASLADLYYRTRRYREAMALAGQILSKDPDEPRALVVMGNVLLSRKKPKEALEYFRLALSVAETDYLWIRVARCHLDLKKPEQAKEALERAESFHAQGRELYRLQARVAQALSDHDAENAAFRRVTQAAPSDEEEFSNFVMPMLSDLPPRKAIDRSEKMRQTSGQELNPYLLLFESKSLLKNRDFKGARKRLRLLLDQDPPKPVRKEARALKAKAERGGS